MAELPRNFDASELNVNAELTAALTQAIEHSLTHVLDHVLTATLTHNLKHELTLKHELVLSGSVTLNVNLTGGIPVVPTPEPEWTEYDGGDSGTTEEEYNANSGHWLDGGFAPDTQTGNVDGGEAS